MILLYKFLLDKISHLDVELDKDSQMALENFLHKVGEKILIGSVQCTTADAQGNLSIVAKFMIKYYELFNQQY